MRLLLYGSLIISCACLLGIFVNHTVKRKTKKYLLAGFIGFYVIFSASVVFIHSANRADASALLVQAEAGESLPTTEAALEFVEAPKTKVAAATKIDVKVGMKPSKLNKPNQHVVMQFLITNKSEDDIFDLRMKFSRGELFDYFYIEEVLGNDKVYIFKNIVTLGDLKAGEERKVQFNLISKNDIDYIGEILWQIGNNYIMDKNTKPLASLIYLPLDEGFESREEYDFENFGSLKSVAEFEEEEAVVAAANSSNTDENTEGNIIDHNDGIIGLGTGIVVETEKTEIVIADVYTE